jgi:hypothetical protein
VVGDLDILLRRSTIIDASFMAWVDQKVCGDVGEEAL